jgi:hypothetical protein
MYTSNPLDLPPYEADLSRQAADRYALLSAVKERRAQQRPTSRRRRAIPVLRRRLAIDAPSGSPGC